MPLRLHILAATIIVLTVLFIYRLVSRQALKSKYALLWSVVAACLLPLAAVPGLLIPVSDLLGIHYPPATILLVTTVFLLVTTVHLSYELSRNERRLQLLAQEVALLRIRLESPEASDDDH